MSAASKISVRLDSRDLAEIQGNLEDFGCKTISDFLRLAASEKLERKKLSGFVEQHLGRLEERQIKFDRAVSLLLTNQENDKKNGVKTIQVISENLAFIASEFAKRGVN